MISLKQLHYALAVAKTLHFRKAAEACSISQSTLSSALNELEKQLGVQIFERDNKRVLVTPMGREILQRAAQIKRQTDELYRLCKSDGKPLGYPMTLGVIPTIGPYLLPKVLPQLRQDFPHAQIRIVEAQSHQLLEKLRLGELDTAILALPYPHDGLLAFEFWQEDFYWVCHKDDISSEQMEVPASQIPEENLLMLAEGNCLKDHALKACRQPDNPNSRNFSATSLHTLVQMVAGRMGTTWCHKWLWIPW